MRKDVRTGAIIGGVLIGTLIVYAVISSTDKSKINKPVVLDGGKSSPAGAPSGGVAASGTPDTASPAAATHEDAPATPIRESATETPAAPAGAPPVAIGEPSVAPPVPEPAGGRSSVNWAAILAADHVDAELRPITTQTPVPTPPAVDPKPAPAPAGNPSKHPPAGLDSGSADIHETPVQPTESAVGGGAPAAAPSTPPRAAPRTSAIPISEKTHKVLEGETFSSISRAVYGDAKYFKEIIKANPNVDPTHLRPGMVINLPDASQFKKDAKPAEKDAGATAKHPTPAPAPVNPKTEYRVQSTDNLYKISVKLYHTPNKVDAIYQLNKEAIGTDPAKLKLGMVLKLPEPPVETASR